MIRSQLHRPPHRIATIAHAGPSTSCSWWLLAAALLTLRLLGIHPPGG